MKRTLQYLLVTGCFTVGTMVLPAQERPQFDAKLEAESTPLILSYVPDYESAEQQEREALEEKIARIDSMEISETRRYKLVRDLYRNRNSKRLNKALMAKNAFEDIPDDQQLTEQEDHKQ